MNARLVHCKKGPSIFSDPGPSAHTLLFLGKSLGFVRFCPDTIQSRSFQGLQIQYSWTFNWGQINLLPCKFNVRVFVLNEWNMCTNSNKCPNLICGVTDACMCGNKASKFEAICSFYRKNCLMPNLPSTEDLKTYGIDYKYYNACH